MTPAAGRTDIQWLSDVLGDTRALKHLQNGGAICRPSENGRRLVRYVKSVQAGLSRDALYPLTAIQFAGMKTAGILVQRDPLSDGTPVYGLRYDLLAMQTRARRSHPAP